MIISGLDINSKRACCISVRRAAFHLRVWSILALLLLPPVVHAKPPLPEYQVKAAFLLNFFKFVEWPDCDKGTGDLVIGILGEDPFGDDIRVIEGETVRDRRIRVERLRAIEEAGRCCMVFVSASEAARLPSIVAAAEKERILTVADTEGFARRGIIINLIKPENRVRFEINRNAARRAGIKISSHLLKLAKIVSEDEEKENSNVSFSQ